jgi:hypothetical protein
MSALNEMGRGIFNPHNLLHYLLSTSLVACSEIVTIPFPTISSVSTNSIFRCRMLNVLVSTTNKTFIV